MPGAPREKTVTDTDSVSVSVSVTDPAAGTGNDTDATAAGGRRAWVATLGSLAPERALRESFLALSALMHEELLGREASSEARR